MGAMDVHVGEAHSRVTVSDSQSLLTPRILEAIVAAVLARLQERGLKDQRADLDRRYQNSVSGDRRA